MSVRLYYDDSYLVQFSARVIDLDAERIRVRLDRSAFYPTSGGQPHDTGTISGIAVVDVVDNVTSSIMYWQSPHPSTQALRSSAASIGSAGSITCSSTRDSTCSPP